MTRVKLKCVLDDCDHETDQLDFDQARSMLDLHMRYAHPNGGANGGDRKLEKTGPSSWRHGNNIRRSMLYKEQVLSDNYLQHALMI